MYSEDGWLYKQESVFDEYASDSKTVFLFGFTCALTLIGKRFFRYALQCKQTTLHPLTGGGLFVNRALAGSIPIGWARRESGSLIAIPRFATGIVTRSVARIVTGAVSRIVARVVTGLIARFVTRLVTGIVARLVWLSLLLFFFLFLLLLRQVVVDGAAIQAGDVVS